MKKELSQSDCERWLRGHGFVQMDISQPAPWGIGWGWCSDTQLADIRCNATSCWIVLIPAASRWRGR
jgi:hypothetical protein